MSLNLLKFYFILIPFIDLFKLEGFFSSLILSDLILLPIALAAMFKLNRLFDKDFWSVFDFLFLLWVIVVALSIFTSIDQNSSFRQLLKSIYLLCLYFSIRLLVEPNKVKELIFFLIFSCTLWSLFAIGAWITATVNQESSIFVSTIKTYPYLGGVFRVQLMTGSPNMLITYLLIGITFSWSKLLLLTNRKYTDFFPFVVLLVALTLTFSRDMLVVVSTIMLTYHILLTNKNKKFAKKSYNSHLLLLLIINIIIIYITLSHFVIVQNNESSIQKLISGQYIFGINPPLIIFTFQNEEFAIFPSIYYELKLAALRIIHDGSVFGVGGDNYNASLLLLKNKNHYPLNFTTWDPHSTYFGVFSEFGVVGLVTVLVIFFYLFNKCFYIIKTKMHLDFINLGFSSLFIGIAIQAICIDIMNFRHYWMLFGLFVASTLKVDSIYKTLK